MADLSTIHAPSQRAALHSPSWADQSWQTRGPRRSCVWGPSQAPPTRTRPCSLPQRAPPLARRTRTAAPGSRHWSRKSSCLIPPVCWLWCKANTCNYIISTFLICVCIRYTALKLKEKFERLHKNLGRFQKYIFKSNVLSLNVWQI